jgi:hypothetical protein
VTSGGDVTTVRVAKRDASDLPMWNELCRACGELARTPSELM